MLTNIQQDVLTEILNINMGKAAKILSEMANQKVILSIPSIDLKKGSEIDMLEFSEVTKDFRSSIMTRMQFGQNFAGKAYIIFPENQSKKLVNACTGLDDDNEMLSEEDLDVIKEISNVILNSLIGEFGNLLNTKLVYSFPEVKLASVVASDNDFFPDNMSFLAMFASFKLSESNIEGMIFIALSTNSEAMLIKKINEMLAEINE